MKFRSKARQNPSQAAAVNGVAEAAAVDGIDRSLEARLVWIWGSPRSGSTWLLKLLSHPLDPDPEAALGFRVPSGHDGLTDSIPVDETFISNHLAPALADPRLVDGRWMPGTINNLLASSKPTYAFSDEYAEVWRPAARDFTLARLQGALDRATKDGSITLDDGFRLVIKETNGSHGADVLMSVVPRSRMLLLIRDGRDVVDSLLAAYQPGAFMANNQKQAISTAEERAEGLRWAARLWACNTDITLKAMESQPDELCRIVRYEDLLDNTADELSALFQWLGIPRSRERVESIVASQSFAALPVDRKGPLTRNRSATPGLWKENLTPAEQAVVNDICGPLLSRFGYEA